WFCAVNGGPGRAAINCKCRRKSASALSPACAATLSISRSPRPATATVCACGAACTSTGGADLQLLAQIHRASAHTRSRRVQILLGTDCPSRVIEHRLIERPPPCGRTSSYATSAPFFKKLSKYQCLRALF